MKYIFTMTIALILASVSMTEAQETEKPDKKEIERIEVISKKPLSYFRRQYAKNENKFVQAFNKLVDDKEFKIICKRVALNGVSRVKVRSCTPAYAETLKQKFVFQPSDLINFEDGPYYADYKKQLDIKTEEHNQKTAELIESSPEFAEKFWAYHNARTALAEKQKLVRSKK